MTPVRGPAVPRRRLGTELRRLREESGLLIEAVAEHLECSTSKISRLETGKGIPKARDIRDLLALYGVTDAKVRERLTRWVRDGQQQGWWHDFSAVLDEKRETFVALEADAARMQGYEPALVHGLFQTADYAREIAKMVLVDPTSADLDKFVELRLQRQVILSRPEGALQLHVIMEEPVLYRPVGGPEVMRGQLRRLLEVAAAPNVDLQVLPLNVGVHPALVGPFALLTFPDTADQGVVIGEGVGGLVILENERDVSSFSRTFDEIQRRALDQRESVAFIASILQGTD